MPKPQNDDRDLLEMLKFELRFLEDGGYGQSPHAARRASLIFEDSLTCMNSARPRCRANPLRAHPAKQRR